MRVTKLWQNCHFGVNYPFNHYCLLIDWSHIEIARHIHTQMHYIFPIWSIFSFEICTHTYQILYKHYILKLSHTQSVHLVPSVVRDGPMPHNASAIPACHELVPIYRWHGSKQSIEQFHCIIFFHYITMNYAVIKKKSIKNERWGLHTSSMKLDYWSSKHSLTGVS